MTVDLLLLERQPNHLETYLLSDHSMEKYTPVKDLPEDIQKLSHEDTVCKFCGVSYLVHHEIKKLEETVQNLTKQLIRLQEMEKEKLSLEEERNEMVESLRHQGQQILALQASLDSIESDLATSRAQFKEQQEELQAATMELRKTQIKEAVVHKTLWEMQSCVAKLQKERESLQQDVLERMMGFAGMKEAITRQYLSVDKHWKSECDTLKQQVGQLQESLEAETQLHSTVKDSWKCTQQCQHELEKQLSESQLLCQELEGRLETTEKKLVAATTDCQRHEQTTVNLTKRVRSLESKLNELRSDNKISTARINKWIENLTSQLKEAEEKVSSSEEQAKQLVRELSQRFATEKETLEVSLSRTETELAALRKEKEDLALRCDQMLQQAKREHTEEVEVERRELLAQYQKELQLLENKHINTYKKNQSKIAELKSTLTVVDLEHQRLVQSLQEELRKEKNVFDRELMRHLDQVKDLELQLVEEQRQREGLTAKADVALAETRQNLVLKEQYCCELESKLSATYQEISVLQATVQRECEEREELLAALEQARTKRPFIFGKHKQTKKDPMN